MLAPVVQPCLVSEYGQEPFGFARRTLRPRDVTQVAARHVDHAADAAGENDLARGQGEAFDLGGGDVGW